MWWNGENGISGPNWSWSSFVGELEERQRATVADAEEAMAIDAQRTEQFILLAPRRQQREAQNILIEMTGRLHVLGDIGIVMQTGSADRPSCP